jgi:hypothetical protein
VNDSERLLAEGTEVTLLNGRKARLRYGMRAIKILEDEFGSVSAIQDHMETDEEGNATGKVFTALWALLRAGLLDEKLSDEELDQLVDPTQVQAYMNAVEKAFTQAFPQAGQGKAESVNGSRGMSSITSPQSATEEVSASSGT